jgi:hypothetical protein
LIDSISRDRLILPRKLGFIDECYTNRQIKKEYLEMLVEQTAPLVHQENQQHPLTEPYL